VSAPVARPLGGPSGPCDPGGLLGNASALLAGRIAVAAMGWAGTVLIVRSLDEHDFGQFSFVFSLLGMLSIVTDLGIGRVAIAGMLDPQRDRAEFVGSYVVLRALLGLFGYGMAVGFVALAGYPATVVQATAVAGLVILLATPSHAYHVAFQAHLRMGSVAVAGVAGQAAQLALTVAIVTAGGTLVWLVVPAVLAEVVILAVTVPQARRLTQFRYVVRPALWRELLREAVPLSIGAAFVTLYNEVDAVMLSKLDTFDSVAVYGVAYKFADLVRFVATALTMPLLSILVRAWPADLDRFRAGLRRGCGFLGFVGGAAIVGSALFARPVVELLYGSTYGKAGGVTSVLIVATVVAFFTRLAIDVLVAAGRRRSYPAIAAAGFALNVGLNVVLIPAYSYRGAAGSTLITEVVVLGILVASIRRIPGLAPVGLGFLARIVVPVAGGLAVGAGAGRFVAWPLAATLSLAAYVMLAHLVRSTGPGGLWALFDERGRAARRR